MTLKLVVKWGAATNFSGEIDEITRKLKVLRQHCAELGRDFDSIVRSSNLNVFLLEPGQDPEQATAAARGKRSYQEFVRGCLVGTPDQVTAHIEKMVEAGINYVITYFPRVAVDHGQLERFAHNVVPRLAAR